MPKFSHSRSDRWRPVAALGILLSTAAPALAQKSSDEYPIYSLDLFAGYQHFLVDNRDSNRPFRIDAGPVLGFRVTEDWWRYVGIEESLTVGWNHLIFYPSGLPGQSVSASQRDYVFAFGPVVYFTPREAKWRPFVTVEPAAVWYKPAISWDTTVNGFVPPAYPLTDQTGPGLIYGGGVKYNASHRVGLRVDIRGLRTGGHEFGAPTAPAGTGTIYVLPHNSENAYSITGGITLRFGYRGGAPPPQPPHVEPPKPVANVRITGVSGAHDVCPGEDVRLEVAAAGWLSDQTPTYQWMVDGNPAPGGTGSSFNVPTQSSGTHRITVRVSAPQSSATSDPVSVTVKNYAPPTVRLALSQSTITFGDKLTLNATATGSDCSGSISVRYTASDGSISGNVFDSSSMAFDQSNRLKQQTRVVHITATATDARGGTGSASADLTVTLSAQARRLDDIIFPTNSARVNNCAKRLLLEQLTPMLRDDPQATVILIGHRDERERAGRGAQQLDRQRALNAAAVISAGQGICPMLELSRVKIGWVGTSQASTPRPLMCGASTDVKERGGQAISPSDQRAQFRRVEVWIVPGGAAMPSEITGLQTTPVEDIKKLGCPK